MNSYRKMMSDTDGNAIADCSPYICKRVAFAINAGDMVVLAIDGVQVPITPENIKKAAQLAKPNYADSEGDDLDILMDGNLRKAPCHECPYFDICDAMENKGDIREDAYSDD